MSAAEEFIDYCNPALYPSDSAQTEADRHRAEDVDFPLVQARAIARGRGETYSPERHGPFEVKLPPRKERGKAPEPEPHGNLAALIDRFMAGKTGPRLHRERKDVAG